jgi:hypothetical protein
MKFIILNFSKFDKIETKSKLRTEGKERKKVIFGFSAERILVGERKPKINLRKSF